MSIVKAKEYLKKYKLDKEVLEFPVSSATVKEAADALSCAESDIAKTLSFYIDEQPILIVVAGDKKIDNSKYKEEFHKKAKMIPAPEVEEVIGHAVGGVCPFGINDGIDVYLDESLKEHEYVYPACGSGNSAIKLSIKQLEKIINNKKWINVCK